MRTPSLSIPIRSDKISLSVQIRAHLCHRKTDFQTIDVFDTEALGRILTLDGHIQLTELDEGVYHEFLVHPALLSIPEAHCALVVGGGDGGVLRELCKDSRLERIDIAEIDSGVVEVSKEWLPVVSAGAFEDLRVRLHVTDAFEFVRSCTQKFDLIVVDSTDTYEEEDGGLSEQLFTADFYRDCLSLLSPQGIVVTQADNPVFCPYSLEHIIQMFRSVFAETGSYCAPVPSFGGYSAFCWGSPSNRVASAFPDEAARELPLVYINKTAYEFAMHPIGFRTF